MENALGVSKAILNHVIFCHQEDSTWPLEEGGKKLKERFDLIFDSDRYNQAVESIKECSKKLNEKIVAELKLEKNLLEDNLNESIKKQKDLDKFHKQLTNYKNEVSEVLKQIASLNDMKKKLTETKIQYEKLYTEKGERKAYIIY